MSDMEDETPLTLEDRKDGKNISAIEGKLSTPQQHTVTKAKDSLTAKQRARIHKHYKSVLGSESSSTSNNVSDNLSDSKSEEAPPTQDKGKGVDPKNWGASELSKNEINPHVDTDNKDNIPELQDISDDEDEDGDFHIPHNIIDKINRMRTSLKSHIAQLKGKHAKKTAKGETKKVASEPAPGPLDDNNQDRLVNIEAEDCNLDMLDEGEQQQQQQGDMQPESKHGDEEGKGEHGGGKDKEEVLQHAQIHAMQPDYEVEEDCCPPTPSPASKDLLLPPPSNNHALLTYTEENAGALSNCCTQKCMHY
ncbi:hypothetical protein CONPUDRAFT_152893 [Coniophora puteana RWD-64-598 SS2]|uniref:Uncharacterized protein n=1 Tax=Coniophora puteana (strain RWD-64-598) TaxID=741705 RepID=A0A5M3MTC3_CONPW|nr:uncharacterized protein CONPUDRAFT_152893 [Coniophora puteana RWD-64-598 SS2]EIW82004.1 hypothetical protein CONPUDRAFT_152893 [Coniophora puteana RWD-64-598 SS2]